MKGTLPTLVSDVEARAFAFAVSSLFPLFFAYIVCILKSFENLSTSSENFVSVLLTFCNLLSKLYIEDEALLGVVF